MSRWYADTSAALKLLVTEDETEALSTAIDTEQPDLVACYLLETEIRRAVARFDELNQSDAVSVLDGIALYAAPPSLFREAGLLPGKHLRSLDALHLATAVRLGVECMITYDARMITAAQEVGVPVSSPA
jgi:predicted nucleic acid-binding protein